MAAINSKECLSQLDFSLNFNSQILSNGETWLASSGLKGLRCVEITDFTTDEPSSIFSAITQYTDCYDCFIDNYGLYTFNLCTDRNITYYIDVSEFGPSFFYSSTGYTAGSIFYLEFLINGQIIQGCFEFSPPRVTDLITYNKLVSLGKVSQNLIGYTAQTDCETCITISPLVYEVSNCDNTTTHYVSLSTNEYVTNLISYTDGIDEFCGYVKNPINESPTHTFVSDYGKGVKCNVCQDVVNEKYKIVNCVDSNINYVVYGSQLFQTGQVSNLSFNDGCFEVSGVTEESVDLNLFFDYEPHNDCNDCIECSGVFYQYSLCSDIDNVIVGEILSYQVIPVGGLFFHPFHNQYCRRQTASNSPSGVYDIFYSVRLANDCSDDLPLALEATECVDGFSTIVMTDVTVGIGNIVQGMWASNNLFCVETTGIPLSIVSGSTYFNTANNNSGTTLIYDLCETCFNNTNVGVNTINCNTSEVGKYNLTYLEWGVLTNFGGFGSQGYSNLCFSDIYDNCWTILECPTSLGTSSLIPVETYFNCPTCKIFNPVPKEPPRSAGTEYFDCRICCECGATGTTVTQVSPPHPVWTDGYGTSVTQMNMITIGGNGLNS